MGSVGVGCTIDKEVIVEVEQSSINKIIFNGLPINFPTVQDVMQSLMKYPVKVDIKSSLPLGYGFGISSAGALGCAYALNKLFKLGKSELELAKIAHIAEIKNYTGLGSVATQITGGFLVKNKPGIPPVVTRLPFVGKKLYVVIIDRLETPTILHDENRLVNINSFANYALSSIYKKNNITLDEIIDISYHFASRAQLITNKEARSVLEMIHKTGNPATISMLGFVVLTTKRFDKIMGHKVQELTISNNVAN